MPNNKHKKKVHEDHEAKVKSESLAGSAAFPAPAAGANPTGTFTSKDGKIGLYLAAMQAVYGNFENMAPYRLPQTSGQGPHKKAIADYERWQPPPASYGYRGRYLWTDAFGVLNFLTLYKELSDEVYLLLAKRLVEAVHETLGRVRDDHQLQPARLPNATDGMPLLGGLRIGKQRADGDDADGQYFHYLIFWMFALNRLSLASGDKWYNNQAVSLAAAIFPRFVYNNPSPRPCVFWKMSMDLSWPLVMSEGNLDPIQGYVVYKVRPTSRTLRKTEVDGVRYWKRRSKFSIRSCTRSGHPIRPMIHWIWA